jgi:hypothetical protein
MFNLVWHFLYDLEVDIGATDASMLFWWCCLFTICSTENLRFTLHITLVVKFSVCAQMYHRRDFGSLCL